MSKEYPCVYFDHEKCTLHGTEPENIDWCVMGTRGSETPSKGDHVRNMEDKALAEFLADAVYYGPTKGRINDREEAVRLWMEWLKQPHKEDT